MKSQATFTWQALLDATGGELISHYRVFDLVAIDTDTRTLSNGAFFLPLTGENFNGNDYIEAAYGQGAEGAFVAKAYLETHPDLKRFPNLIAVEDPLMTYLKLGQYHRHRSQAKIIAITGSSGKTTTKEMLFQMLQVAFPNQAQRTEKNFNNEVGVARTLLDILPDTRAMVVEMGMRGLNQIRLLSVHAEPDVSVITNIGPAHIGLLGSLEAIARAKSEIFEGLDPKTGVGIINGDDPLLVEVASRSWSGQMEPFSLHEVEEIHTLANGKITFDYDSVTFTLGLPGSHNVMNALACIKVCETLGIPLKQVADALAEFNAGGGRWEKQPVEGRETLWVINDAYNANPSSMRVSLGTFMDTQYQGLKKIAVIGPMAELGDFSQQYHRELGEWLINRDGLDGLVVFGHEATPIAEAVSTSTLPVFKAESHAEAVSLLLHNWPSETIFFLKASRESHLEEIPLLLKPAQAPYAVP